MSNHSFNQDDHLSQSENIHDRENFQMNFNNAGNTSFTRSMNNSYYHPQQYRNNQDNNTQQNINNSNNSALFFPSQNFTNLNNFNNLNNLNNTKDRVQMDTQEMIKLLIKQYEFFLQILIQNVLLTSDQGLKFRCYNMIFSFYMIRQRIIQSSKLHEFEVNFDFTKIFNENKDIKLHPQISFFQAPILEILPVLVKFMKRTFSKDELCIVLKEFFPFINPHFLPINKGVINSLVEDEKERDEEDNSSDFMLPELKNNFLQKKRKKFDSIHDHLLMLGLMHHGKKNLELVQQLWVNSRSLQEIKHRIKNLTCKRAPENIIKHWKLLSESPPTKEEFFAFLKGIQWFGNKKKWNAIARYFLPDRSAEYIEK